MGTSSAGLRRLSRLSAQPSGALQKSCGSLQVLAPSLSAASHLAGDSWVDRQCPTMSCLNSAPTWGIMGSKLSAGSLPEEKLKLTGLLQVQARKAWVGQTTRTYGRPRAPMAWQRNSSRPYCRGQHASRREAERRGRIPTHVYQKLGRLPGAGHVAGREAWRL